MLLTMFSIVQSYTYSTRGLWTEMDEMDPEYFKVCFHRIILNCAHGKRITCSERSSIGPAICTKYLITQIVINETCDKGEIVLPNEESYGQSYPIIPCVDDTLIILHDDLMQLDTLKDIITYIY